MMNDLDPCPFGTHHGTLMQDVPASWLIFLYNEIYEEEEHGLDPDGDRADVYEYIKENIAELAGECEGVEVLGYDDGSVYKGANKL
jgi:hypothetical protein